MACVEPRPPRNFAEVAVLSVPRAFPHRFASWALVLIFFLVLATEETQGLAAVLRAEVMAVAIQAEEVSGEARAATQAAGLVEELPAEAWAVTQAAALVEELPAEAWAAIQAAALVEELPAEA